MPNINPSNVTDVVGEYARAGEAQVRAAIAAARAAFPTWSHGRVQARADMLDAIGNEILARKEELGILLSREEGKTKPEGIGEATRAGYLFKFFAGEVVRQAGELLPSVRPGIKVEITREPVGVVGIITPWNFPIAIPRGRSPRRSPTATAWCSSPRTSCPAAPGRSPRSSRAPGCRRASSTW